MNKVYKSRLKDKLISVSNIGKSVNEWINTD